MKRRPSRHNVWSFNSTLRAVCSIRRKRSCKAFWVPRCPWWCMSPRLARARPVPAVSLRLLRASRRWRRPRLEAILYRALLGWDKGTGRFSAPIKSNESNGGTEERDRENDSIGPNSRIGLFSISVTHYFLLRERRARVRRKSAFPIIALKGRWRWRA